MTQIVRYRGDTIPDRAIVQDSEGDPIDITGYTFVLTVNKQKEPADTAQQLMQLEGVITDGPAGKVEFRPTAEEANVTPGKYYYDVQMTDTGGRIQTIIVSTYQFKQDITK